MKLSKLLRMALTQLSCMLVIASLAACDGGVELTSRSGVETQESVSIAVQSGPARGASADSLTFLRDVVASKGSYRLMSMGDSITHGRGDASYRRELSNMLLAQGCPAVLVGSQASSDTDTPHEGYSGHSTTDFLVGRAANKGAAHSVSELKPDIVLLHIGSVDLYRGADVAQALAGVDQLIATIQSANPGTFVLLANLIPWLNTERNASLPVAGAQLGDQIEQYVAASGNPLLQLVDVRSGFSADHFVDDYIHPNEKGDAHIADAFYDHLYSNSICVE